MANMCFPCFLVAVGILALAARFSYAEDLITLDGKKYADITNVSKYPQQVYFTCSTNRIGVAITNLPDDFDERHGIVTANILLKRAKAGDASATVAVGDDLFKKWRKEISDFFKTNNVPTDPNKISLDPNTGLPIGLPIESGAIFYPTNSANFCMSMDWYKKAALLGMTNAM